MRCPVRTREKAEIILDYCSGTLDQPTRLLFERHLTGCPDCQSVRDRQNSVWSIADDWVPAPISLDFNRRLYQRIEREERESWWSHIPSFCSAALQPSVPMVGACLVVVASLFYQSLNPAPEQAADAVSLRAETETADVEGAEQALEDIELLRSLPIAGVTSPPHSI